MLLYIREFTVLMKINEKSRHVNISMVYYYSLQKKLTAEMPFGMSTISGGLMNNREVIQKRA